MKTSLFRLLAVLIISVACFQSIAQDIIQVNNRIAPTRETSSVQDDAITKVEENYIKVKAKLMVKDLNMLLNTIASALDLEPLEVEGLIQRSLSENKVFYDSSTLIQDDLTYFDNIKMAKEKPVLGYLKDFDIFYNKSETESVKFMNVTTSNIKKGEYLYIKVFYDCLLTNKSRKSEKPIPLQKRVAELKVEKIKGKWRTWIIDIHFLTPNDTASLLKDDVPIIDDVKNDNETIEKLDSTSSSINLVVAVPERTPEEKERIRKQNDSLRTYMAYRAMVDSGNHARRASDYVTAYQFYNQCETIINGSKNVITKNDVEFVQTMVNDVRNKIKTINLTPEERYKELMAKALAAEYARNYEDARESYNKALALKPDEADKLDPKIKKLTSRISNLARLNAKYLEGKYKEAINDYEKAIEADPTNSDYYVGRAKCYEKTKDEKKALKDYEKAAEVDATNLEAYQLKGALYERKGNYAQALADFSVCANINKNDINYYLKMAELNLAMNHPNEAIQALDKGISNNKEAALLYNRKGEIMLDKLGKPGLAQSVFSDAIEIDSTNAPSYYHRGLCYIDQKKIEMASADFAKARKFKIDSSSLKIMQQLGAEYYARGLAMYNGGRLDSATTLFNYAVLIDPLKDEYRFQKGEGYFRQKRFDEAVKNYTEAIELNPKSYNAYKQRAISKINQSKYGEAIADLEQAIKINPKSAEVYKYTGDAYFKWKKYNDAIKQYGAALTVASRNELSEELLTELYNYTGESYYQTDNYKLALENFKNAAKYSKNSGEILYNRGKTYLKLEQLDDAEADLNKALGISSTDANWNYALGEVHQQKGKLDKAISQYNTAIGLNQSQTLPAKVFYDRANCFAGLDNYADALKDYLTLKNLHADDEFPAFNVELANIYLYLNQPDSALTYVEKAISKNPSDAEAIYTKAVVYVEKRQNDEALTLFVRAFTLAKFQRSRISKDSRLEPIKNEKDFKSLLKKYT